jgi:hypothetical protein
MRKFVAGLVYTLVTWVIETAILYLGLQWANSLDGSIPALGFWTCVPLALIAATFTGSHSLSED